MVLELGPTLQGNAFSLFCQNPKELLWRSKCTSEVVKSVEQTQENPYWEKFQRLLKVACTIAQLP